VPLPFFARGALKGKGPDEAWEDCCYDYSHFQFPYQFRECEGTSNCTTCWLQSGEAELARRPTAQFGAIAWAAALAVNGPRHFGPNIGSSRKLSEVPVELEHAKIQDKQMIGMTEYGSRQRVANLCPQVRDWQIYYLNEEGENIHARVYKSRSAQVAIVAFRGTQPGSRKNWEIDTDIRKKRVELGPGQSTYIHAGFLDALERVLPRVKKWVNGYVMHTLGAVPKNWRLVFAGHSMGGALATLAATMAEVQGWYRKPDAIITFGAPRVADGNLTEWWAAHGLCNRMLRVNVYNDVVHWTPFTADVVWWKKLVGCVTNFPMCLGQNFQSLAMTPKDMSFSHEWQHVCPDSEFLIPGAMMGLNPSLTDFSPVGAALAHFLGNALFGYGYGMLYGGFIFHDNYCGLSPEVFPDPVCTVVEDLTSVQCFGLGQDVHAKSPEVCHDHCCADPYCKIWQWTVDGQCWRGRSNMCRPNAAWASRMVTGKRLK